MKYRIQSHLKSGNEQFIGLDHNLLDYWRWAHSDIAANSERGKLAEYIVKCAVGSPSLCRIEWDSVDIISKKGVRIEVKSSAYLQTWNCTKLSSIKFDIAPKRSWFSETNQYSETASRNSDIYIFCLFACKEPKIANPLDLTQWEFYIISTKTLDKNVPLQKTITLNALMKIGAKKTDYSNISEVIDTIVISDVTRIE